MYMEDGAVRQLLSTAAGAFRDCAFLGYDPVRPSDAFGEIMVQNLAAMGAPFVGIHDCPDEGSHLSRALQCGFEWAAALDLSQAWSRALTQAQLLRLQRLEPLDETEEWDLMMRHYALVGAVKGSVGGLAAGPTEQPAAAAAAAPPGPAADPPPPSSSHTDTATAEVPALPVSAVLPAAAAAASAAEPQPTRDGWGGHPVLQLFKADEVKHTADVLEEYK